MRIIFNNPDSLINYLNKKLYLNVTTDPSNLKYLYEDLVLQIEGGEFFNLFTDTCLLFIYTDRKNYIQIDLIEALPLNSSPSFIDITDKATLEEILEIADGLRYNYTEIE